MPARRGWPKSVINTRVERAGPIAGHAYGRKRSVTFATPGAPLGKFDPGSTTGPDDRAQVAREAGGAAFRYRETRILHQGSDDSDSGLSAPPKLRTRPHAARYESPALHCVTVAVSVAVTACALTATQGQQIPAQQQPRVADACAIRQRHRVMPDTSA